MNICTLLPFARQASAEDLTGVMSVGDVVMAPLDEQKPTIEQLEHYVTDSRWQTRGRGSLSFTRFR